MRDLGDDHETIGDAGACGGVLQLPNGLWLCATSAHDHDQVVGQAGHGIDHQLVAVQRQQGPRRENDPAARGGQALTEVGRVPGGKCLGVDPELDDLGP